MSLEAVDETTFYNEYEAFLVARGKPVSLEPPVVMSKPADLYALYSSVRQRGGYNAVRLICRSTMLNRFI